MDAALTLQEVAHFLKLSESTITSMVQRGEIPAERVGSQLMFQLDVLENWLETQLKSVQTRMVNAPFPDADTLRLSTILDERHVLMDVPGGEKDAVLRALIGPLMETGLIASATPLLPALLTREKLMSTGVGHGVALPHPRHPMPFVFEEPAVVVGLSRSGVAFEAIDGGPIHVFFLVGAPNDPWHLWTLASISEIVHQPDAVGKLTEAATPAEVIQTVRAVERACRAAEKRQGGKG